MLSEVKAWGTLVKDNNGFHFKIVGKETYHHQLQDFILRGQSQAEIKVTVNLDLEPKSNKQLRYWWGVVCVYAAIAFERAGWPGMNKDSANYELLQMFYSDQRVNKITSEVRNEPKSLKTISKEDMRDLIDKSIQLITFEYGVPVPAPGEDIFN